MKAFIEAINIKGKLSYERLLER